MEDCGLLARKLLQMHEKTQKAQASLISKNGWSYLACEVPALGQAGVVRVCCGGLQSQTVFSDFTTAWMVNKTLITMMKMADMTGTFLIALFIVFVSRTVFLISLWYVCNV